MEKTYAKFVKPKGNYKGEFKIIFNDKVILTAVARSGQPNMQDCWTVGLSPIPPSNAIKGSYSINLDGYAPGDMNACGDIFFPISPDPIISKDGYGRRSEIGLHEDANYDYSSGTAGCIGISPAHWDKVKATIKTLKNKNIHKIPLYVVYV